MRVWQLAQVGFRLCASSLSNSVSPPNSFSSAGIDPASAGGGGVGVPSTRRRTQSPRFTGLVRSGADVAVSTAPRRSKPPRWNSFAPSTSSGCLSDLISFFTP